MEQRSDEWYLARKRRVTGSRVGAILGLSPWQSRADVMRSMLTGEEFVGNAATEWGTVNEPTAIGMYELDTGNKVAKVGFVMHDDWLGASPDGLVNGNRVLEVKCPYGMRNAINPEFKTLAEQPHYYAQVQIEMFVTDRQFCDFFQWCPAGYKLETVPYDPQWIGQNLPKLRAFWDEFMVLSGVDERPFEMLRELHERAKAAEAEYESLKNELCAKYGECDVAGVSIRKVVKAGSVSYSKVVKDHLPELDLEPYRGAASEFWKVTV